MPLLPRVKPHAFPDFALPPASSSSSDRSRHVSFDVSGSGRLASFLVRCLKLLPEQKRVNLKEYLLSGKCRCLGTMCSGTESPMLVARALRQALATVGICDWDPSLGFCSDSDKHVRSFLHHMVRPSFLFPDCKALVASHALDDSNTLVKVPAVHLLVAGYPCPDVSRLNAEAKASRPLVMQGRLRTGGVFKEGILGYCKQHVKEAANAEGDLKAALTENVVGLADVDATDGNSPLDWVSNEWHLAGWWMFPLMLHPTLFGFMVRRPRIWMPAIPYSSFAQRGMSTDEAAEDILSTIHLCMQAGQEVMWKFRNTCLVMLTFLFALFP